MRRRPVIVLAAFAALPGAAHAATITVDSTAQATGGAACTLDDAVKAANTNAVAGGCAAGSGADTISLPAGTYERTIQLTLAGPTTIDGAGSGQTIIDGTGTTRILRVNAGADLQLQDVTLRNGSGNTFGGAISALGPLTITDAVLADNALEVSGYNFGGAIRSENARLRLVRTILTGNEAAAGTDLDAYSAGGAVSASGSVVEIVESAFTGNVAGDEGAGRSSGYGGALAVGGGSLTVTGSTFTGNRSVAGGSGVLPHSVGGAIAVFDAAKTRLVDTTLQANRASRISGLAAEFASVQLDRVTVADGIADGLGSAAIAVEGAAATVMNSTVAGNTGEAGLLFFDVPDARIASSTIAGNLAGVWHDHSGQTTFERGVIVSGNTHGNCDGNVLADATSLAWPATDTSCPAAITRADPKLGALAGNGGLVPTMALGAGSAALGLAGATCEPTDARGVVRPLGGSCDAGAYEAEPPVASALVATGVTHASARLTGSVDPKGRDTTWWVRYTPEGGARAETAKTAAAGGEVAVDLTGLRPDTVHRAVLVASSDAGTVTGPEVTFRTLAAPVAPEVAPPKPIVVPLAPATLRSTRLTLTRKRTIAVSVRCPGVATVRLTIRTGRTKVATKRLTCTGAGTKKLTLKVSRSTYRKLRRLRRSFRAKATLTTTAGGRSVTRTATLRIRRK